MGEPRCDLSAQAINTCSDDCDFIGETLQSSWSLRSPLSSGKSLADPRLFGRKVNTPRAKLLLTFEFSFSNSDFGKNTIFLFVDVAQRAASILGNHNCLLIEQSPHSKTVST